MDLDRHFKTLDEFNRGYAGPQTLLLEKKSRELAGRQDKFCLICGDDKVDLFPQLGKKEIHLCPRRFCKRCYHIEADWKIPSHRFNHPIYTESEFVPLCCTLCWKRGWDIVNPLLGQDQPEWQTWTGEPMEDVLNRRYNHWEVCAVAKEYAEQFQWRLPLRHLPDDMTLESDRKLLKAIKNRYLKKPTRFNKFKNIALLESSPPLDPTFNVRQAFEDINRRLLKLIRPDGTDTALKGRAAEEEEAGEQEEMEDREETGDEEEHEPTEQVQQTSLQPIACRPQRRAAQFSFAKVKGIPVRQSKSTPLDGTTNCSPGGARDMLDRPTTGLVDPCTPHTRRSLHTRASTQHMPRPRGRPRKVTTDPASPLPSPSTQEDQGTPSPSFMRNGMPIGEDSDSEEYDKIKAMMDNKHEQGRNLKEANAQQKAQLRLLNKKLERSQAMAENLVQERESFSTTESKLRHQISAIRVANAALQLTVAESKEEHESQLQTIAGLNRRIAQQAEQTTDVRNLLEEIEGHKRRYVGLEADLEASRAKESELSTEINNQRETYDEQRKTLEKLEKENRDLFQGIARCSRGLRALIEVPGTMDGKSRAMPVLRADQDEVLEANKQLCKDGANLGAELAANRGLGEVDGAQLQQHLADGSLPSDLVERLVQNPSLEVQMLKIVGEGALRVLRQSSSDPQYSQMGSGKRRRTGSVADLTEPSWPRGDTELYD